MASLLEHEWRIAPKSLKYRALGFGSYHWEAWLESGKRYFLTVDDLDQKPWLGANRSEVFLGLRRAMDTALWLRETARLDFVVAPIRTRSGESAVLVSERYAMAVFPFLEGESGDFGDHLGAGERRELMRLLAALHHVTPLLTEAPPERRPEIPERAMLESAIQDADLHWDSGPFAEPAQRMLRDHGERVVEWLGTYDSLAQNVLGTRRQSVITHGEPHPGNIMRRSGRMFLIDWDTVALAPRERDLWMLDDGSPDALRDYAEAAGEETDPSALDLYRLNWKLSDIASFTALLRSPHGRAEDAQFALRCLEGYLLGADT